MAKCDRKRVLSTWAPLCGGMVPLEFQVEFSKVRHLRPREFVERLSKDLRISGVVAGTPSQLLTIDSLNVVNGPLMFQERIIGLDTAHLETLPS